MSRIPIAGLAILLLLGIGSKAQAKDDLWIHVSVDGGHDETERVRVNLPLDLVATVLPLIEQDDFHHGHIRVDHGDLDREQVVAILRAVADAKEGEYVTVQDENDMIRVAKEKDILTVKVEENGSDEDRGDHVDIRVPMPVVQALVSGKDDELDVLAAVKALGDEHKGTLVTVNDDDGSLVKVWIDDRNTTDD